MRVYLPGSLGKKLITVTPANLVESSEFMDEAGKPRTFDILFVNGKAEVSDRMGTFLLKQGLAKRSPLILPSGA